MCPIKFDHSAPMSSYFISQSENYIEFKRRMPKGLRLVLVLIGLVPWIAPYELLVKPRWTTWLDPFILLPLGISLGAIVVSVFFIFFALGGLSEHIRFDIPTKTLTYVSESPLTRLRQNQYNFSDIDHTCIVEHDWSEGPTTYNLQVQMKRGLRIEFGDFDSRADAEHYQQVLQSAFDQVQA